MAVERELLMLYVLVKRVRCKHGTVYDPRFGGGCSECELEEVNARLDEEELPERELEAAE
jgi:hypothetical protein